MHALRLLPALLATLFLFPACSSEPDEVTDDKDKSDVAAVEDELSRVAADGELTAEDVSALFEAAGNRVNMREMLAIRDALEDPNLRVTEGATQRGLELARLANLFDVERAHLSDPQIGLFSFGGNEVPDAVTELLSRARLSGAQAYDVRDTNSDGELKWTPYPSTTPPVENMAFDHTEISGDIVRADLADTAVKYNAITSFRREEVCDANGDCETFDVEPIYEERTGGTGNVLAHYDEAGNHPDIFARGREGQKWANNCSILVDGSIHCLPAARRSLLQDLILTNPHLSRCNDFPQFADSCRQMLYNGHIDIRRGVVVGVEVSGRVAKHIARGNINMIDPIAVLEAWGFEISPNLTIRYGNTESGIPVRDLEHGVLTAAP